MSVGDGYQDISTMSDVALQHQYWSMNLDSDEALNDRIAEELSSRRIGIDQALRDMASE